MIRDHAEAYDAWNDLTMAGTELDLAPTTRGPPRAGRRSRRRPLNAQAPSSAASTTLAELDEGSRLISRIWDDEDGEPKAPTSLLRALAHAGNFVAGAFHGDRLVGVSFGFFGLDSASCTSTRTSPASTANFRAARSASR